jgi:hypothetical protein
MIALVAQIPGSPGDTQHIEHPWVRLRRLESPMPGPTSATKFAPIPSLNGQLESSPAPIASPAPTAVALPVTSSGVAGFDSQTVSSQKCDEQSELGTTCGHIALRVRGPS